MSAFFDQPVGAILESAPNGKVAPEAQAVVARMAQMAYEVATSVGKGDLLRALSTSTPTAFLGAFAELMSRCAPASPEALNALRGRIALAESIERSGGIWKSDEAQAELDVSRATLQSWRDSRRVLALPFGDGSFGYPVAQFAAPSSDLERPRPNPAIAEVLHAAGDAIAPQELFLLLATPQPALALDHGGEARSGFDAMRDGDGALVVSLVTHLVTPSDEGAPAAA